jgi:hypothetical protein
MHLTSTMYYTNADRLHLSLILILSSLLNHGQYGDTNADATDSVLQYYQHTRIRMANTAGS